MERDTHQGFIQICWAMSALSVLFIPVFLLVQVATCSNTVEMNFDGSSFVTYRLNMPLKSVNDEIYLLFRSIKPSGLLLHAAGGSGDFVTLELLRGKLRYTSNLGDTGSQSGYYEKLLGKDLADNEWHQVDVKRNGKMMDLRVDVDRMTFELPGKLITLDLDGKIYIAGIDEEGKKAFRRQREQYPFKFFAGCLEDAVINRLNVLQKVKNKSRSAAVHGNEVYGCREETGYYPITFLLPASYLLVQAPELSTFNFSFKFRTYERDGMLLYQDLQNYGGAGIFLSLETGRVKLQVTFQRPRLPVTLHAGFALEDGLWHSISVSISGLSATLFVDKDKTSHTIDASLGVRFSNSRNVKIAASYKHLLGFIGCMYNIKVQGQKVNITNVVSGLRVLRGKCSLKDSCLPNPCKNVGRCTQKHSRKVCDCSQTDYKGDLCDVPAFENKQTCADWRNAGFTRDTFYKISPKRKKPFSCYCEMSNIKGAATIINHSRGRNPTIASQGKISDESLGRHFYHHPITYETDMENIRALIETSIYCRQYIKYSCQNSSLFDSPKKFDKYRGRGGRWVSYDNQVQDYWGGATPGSEKCACGLIGTCAEANKACNCDTTDNTWRSDEGYINASSKLPVKMLIFSVSGTSQRSFYTLGSLQCFGSTTIYSTQPSLRYNSTSTILHSGSKESLTTASTHGSETPAASTAATTTTSNGTASSPSSLIRTDSSLRGPLTTVHGASKTSAPTIADTIETISTKETGLTTVAHPPPALIIIDSPRKYITIKEDSNQELVLIILSIILALFILAIIALIIKQQILYACKCIDAPTYSDVQHSDSIELGPSPPYRHKESLEILQYETSPYPPRGYELEFSHRRMENVSPRVIRLAGRSFHLTQSESDADTDTDRLDVSNDSSLTSTSSCNTNGCPNEKLKPIVEVEESEKASVETSPLKSQPTYKVDSQYEQLKDVFLDVITRNSYSSDRTFEEKNIFKVRTKTENGNIKRRRKLSSPISDFPSCASDQESSTSLNCKTFSCDESSDDEGETETSSFVNSLRRKTRHCQDSFCNDRNSKDSLNVYLSLEDPPQDNTYLREEQTHSSLNQSDSLKTICSPSSNNTSIAKQTKHFIVSQKTQKFQTPKICDFVIVNRAPDNGAACGLLDPTENEDSLNNESCSFNDSINSEREGPLINNKLKNVIFDSQASLEVSSEDNVLISDEYETEI